MQPTIPVLSAHPVTDLIQQARQGVLRRRVDEVARLAGLTDIEMARVLNMSVRGLHGKAATELLTLAASERLLLLERLVLRGLFVFDGRADLLGRWLRTPLTELAYHQQTSKTDIPVRPLSVGDMGSFTQLSEPSTQAVESVEAGALATPIPQSPLAVLDTVSGFSLAEDVLGRIEWGIAG